MVSIDYKIMLSYYLIQRLQFELTQNIYLKKKFKI